MAEIQCLSQLGQAAAGIGDSGEMRACLIHTHGLAGTVVKEFQQGHCFDCAARFCRRNKKRPGRVQPLGLLAHSIRVGTVQDTEIQVAFSGAKGTGKDFGSQAGSSHAQEQDVGVAGCADGIDHAVDFI